MSDIDPALSENLRELADLAREAGADQVILLRNLANTQLTWQLANLDRPAEPGATLIVQTVLPLPDSGALLVIRFPATDGGEKPIEVL